MRLGGPVLERCDSPEEWAGTVKRLGYGAAYCPVQSDADERVIQAYAREAEKADIVIAEVGAWSNPLSAHEQTRRKALAHCRDQLALADQIGARCCVNISGSRGELWDGPHPDNLTEATFDLIVHTVREIIDEVRPTRACYTLETMPWMYPNSPQSYLRLLKAIDRKQFGVHLDPVNLVCDPQRYFRNGALIRECFETLGTYIRSCHAKDIKLSGRLTLHLDEVRPGLGNLDYREFLQRLNRLGSDVPLMLEHLKTAEDYALAAHYIRSIAQEVGAPIEEQ